MDLFEKCEGFFSDPKVAQAMGYATNPRTLQALGFYPFFIPLDQTEGTEVTIQGRRMIMIGSNNYLGLTTHPKVRQAAIDAIREFGTSCTGSRFLNGTLAMHQELEEKLAEYVGKEKALVFSTGYQTNLGIISALIGKGDVVIIDKEDHASIVDGCRLALGQMKRFRHNDMADLERVLQGCPEKAGKLVIMDGVFSMGGDIAPLPEIVPLCQKYGARLMVDDAHAMGVLGGGRGTAAHFGVTDDVDLIMGTFSKSFASIGGFIAGDEATIHWIQHFSRSLIFSASLPAPNVAAVLAALEVMKSEPERGNPPSVPPAVPEGKSLLRTSYMATHTDEQLDRVLEMFEKVGKEQGLIS